MNNLHNPNGADHRNNQDNHEINILMQYSPAYTVQYAPPFCGTDQLGKFVKCIQIISVKATSYRLRIALVNESRAARSHEHLMHLSENKNAQVLC